MEEQYGTIYIATNLSNKKQYIGQTIQPIKERIREHKNSTIKTNTCFGNAIKKYGIDGFKWIYFSCLEEDLDWCEVFLIKKLNTLSPNGYNLTSGGQKGPKHLSAETIKKIIKNHWSRKSSFIRKIKPPKKTKEEIRQNRIEYNKTHPSPLLGRSLSPETIRKISIAKKEYYTTHSGPMKGKIFSAEHRKNISKNHADFRGNKNGNFGRPHTEEERIKMRAPRPSIRGKNHPLARPVILISPLGEKYLLDTYVPFCKEHNLNAACIHNVLWGKQKNHKGWTGRYLEEEK